VAQNLGEPVNYPKAKAKDVTEESGQNDGSQMSTSEKMCLGGMKRIGSGLPHSDKGINYPNRISGSCPVGGPYIYSRDWDQPGNTPGYQCYFLIRCRAPEHAKNGYNSIEGPVDPTLLKKP
jgi:hypothetical protein